MRVRRLPDTANDSGDLIVEYKNVEQISKSQFNYLVAAIKFSTLALSISWGGQRQSAAGGVASTWPRTQFPCCLDMLGANMPARGYARLCGGLILQLRMGLRPSEMPALLPEDIAFSEDSGIEGPGRVDVALGARVGTKANRKQNVAIYSDTDPDSVFFMRWVCQSTPSKQTSLPIFHGDFLGASSPKLTPN